MVRVDSIKIVHREQHQGAYPFIFLQVEVYCMCMVHEIIKVFHWEADEFEYYAKKIDWYWWLGALVLVGSGAAIYFKNYFFAAFILLAGVVIVMYTRQTPDPMEVSVSEQGVKIDGVMYPYRTLDGFWIAEHENGHIHLLLHSPTAYSPLHSIPVPDFIDILDLREYLAVFLQEREMTEPLLQRIGHRLKF